MTEKDLFSYITMDNRLSACNDNVTVDPIVVCLINFSLVNWGSISKYATLSRMQNKSITDENYKRFLLELLDTLDLKTPYIHVCNTPK